MMVPSPTAILKIKNKYPVGTRIELISMEDVQAPPVGMKGTVVGVDDMGDLLVDWDNGSGLKIILGQDSVKIINENSMTEIIKEQILLIRDTGLTNMFDVRAVQRIAYEMDLYELVSYLEENSKEYAHFIITGKNPLE